MYTLMHTACLAETQMADYFTHCYSEGEILVRGRCAITNIPESVSQLQVAFQFDVLGTFPTKQDAESARDLYIETGSIIEGPVATEVVASPSPVVDETPAVIPTIPTMKLHKILNDEAAKYPDRQVPWFGDSLKVVREKKDG